MMSNSNNNIYALGVLHCSPTIGHLASYTANKYFTDDAIQLVSDSNFNIDVGKSGAFRHNGLIYLFVGDVGDVDDIVYYVIARGDYQTRLIRDCVGEIKLQYDGVAKSGKKITNLALRKICEKYENPQQFDRISQVNEKINQTKSVMIENIDLALANCSKLEDIELGSQELMISAGIFGKNAERLRRKMWWKNMKMKILLAAIILTILGIIIGVAVGMSQANK